MQVWKYHTNPPFLQTQNPQKKKCFTFSSRLKIINGEGNFPFIKKCFGGLNGWKLNCKIISLLVWSAVSSGSMLMMFSSSQYHMYMVMSCITNTEACPIKIFPAAYADITWRAVPILSAILTSPWIHADMPVNTFSSYGWHLSHSLLYACRKMTHRA